MSIESAPQGGAGLQQGERRSPQSKKAKVSKFKLDCRPGVFSSSRPLLERDKALVKRIQKGVQLKRPAEVQSALIRRHYLELTQAGGNSIHSRKSTKNAAENFPEIPVILAPSYNDLNS